MSDQPATRFVAEDGSESGRPAALCPTASVVERAKLRRELGRLDTVMFLIAAMVVVDTIGAVASGGAQALIWLFALFALFFVPSALASAELGAALPEEGGAYVWVREAFGRFAGGLASLLYWAGAPVWVGGSVVVVAIAAWERFVSPLGTAATYGFGAAFIGVVTVAAVLPLRIGKWVPTLGGFGQVVLLAFFTATVVAYGARHGLHGMHPGAFRPTGGVFLSVVPVLVYCFVGIELPTAAAEEMRNPRRDIPAAILRAGSAQIVMYAVPVLAILVVLPADRLSSLHGLLDALATVLTVYGGTVAADGAVHLTGAGAALGAGCAVLLLAVLAASGTAWLIGTGRAQAAACLDGAGPAYFGRISARTGVPVRIALVSGAVALLTMSAGLAMTGGQRQRYFSAALTLDIALIMLAYMLIFPSFVALRLRRPDLPRPFRVPGGVPVAWLVSAVATGWAALCAALLVWPGLGTAHPDGALPNGFAGQRGLFELLVLGPVLATVAVHAAFYASSRRRAAADRIPRQPTGYDVTAPCPAPGAAPAPAPTPAPSPAPILQIPSLTSRR